MKIKIHYCLIPVSLLLASCSFNHSFYHPDKIPANAKGTFFLDHESGDTIRIHITGENHQPAFLKSNEDTLDLGFIIESVLFKNGDGKMLNGWMVKPKNTFLGITLLHLHGNAGNLFSQYQLITPLVKKGFQVFLFDYSGYGFSEGKATRNNVLKDAIAAVNYLKTREDVSGTKLVIYGQSIGGHLAAAVAEAMQGSIDGLVMEGAFSSHKDIAAYMTGLGFIARLLVSEHYSAVESIKNYKKPLLVIHSTEDKTIPYSMGEKIFEKANSPKSFYEIKGCHICGPQFYADSIAIKIKAMFVK